MKTNKKSIYEYIKKIKDYIFEKEIVDLKELTQNFNSLYLKTYLLFLLETEDITRFKKDQKMYYKKRSVADELFKKKRR